MAKIKVDNPAIAGGGQATRPEFSI